MSEPRLTPELSALRNVAEELARSRRERPTSAHLLAALAARPGAVSELLARRGLTQEQLLRTTRSTTDDPGTGIVAILTRARELATRGLPGAVTAGHVLAAALAERRSAAFRAVDQCGVDVGRLRTAALELAMGAESPAPRREPPVAEAEAGKARAGAPLRRVARVAPGQTVPLFPPPRDSRASGDSAPGTGTGDAPLRGGTAPAPPAASPPEPPPALAAPRPAIHPGRSATRRARRHEQERFELPPDRFPVLASLGRNLTLAAARGELDPAVGRDREIEQVLDVLAKRHGNSPCLVGPAGVGKTSVVRGLAQRIAAGSDVVSLDDRIVIEVPAGELLAGTAVRGSLASRVTALRKEVAEAKGRVVLFFDEVHQLFQAEVGDELSGELRLALARGELPCIGAATPEEYRRTIEADPVLARRFVPLEVEEPSREDAYLVLESLAERLEGHHRVRFRAEALATAVAWSVRYLPGRALPDKAVGIVDLAGARARRRGRRHVEPADVAEVVAELADVPLERLLEEDGERFLRLEAILAERVVGHRDAIVRIARMLRRNAAGLGSRRPVGTFLLLGPTGVGKTETAKAVAEVLFHDEHAMTRIDLSEYSEQHAVARLIGAPPGYVGHEAGGHLTESVRKRPYQVVLLDEIEKAHPDVLLCFLGVFDEGRLTDGRGRLVDFTNTVLFLTSNLGGAEAHAQRRRVGFGADAGEAEVEARVTAAARAALPPELYNRIDEVLVFAPLGRPEVREVARRMLAGVAGLLLERRGVHLAHDDEVLDALLDAGGFDPSLGARPMRRTVARLVEAPLAELILSGRVAPGETVRLRAAAGEIVLEPSDRAAE